MGNHANKPFSCGISLQNLIWVMFPKEVRHKTSVLVPNLEQNLVFPLIISLKMFPLSGMSSSIGPLHPKP